ncbi:MAG: hypothetical protein IT305_06085 [Chloroflexi bacterium]|nr:hypothetical protein [Chloroflexota bacterium]
MHQGVRCAARFVVVACALILAFAQLAPATAGVTAGTATSAYAASGSAPDGSAATSRDPRFGLNDAWRVGDAADRAGAGWSRILFWWSEMQKSGPGDLDLFATGQDGYILAERGHGRELVGGVLNTPGWASSDGSPNGVPKNLYLPWDHPDNYWGQFMRQMAEHYRGKVDTWIIWNEIDIAGGQWNTWHGSLEDYVQLQKVAYRAIKAGNPNATVLPFGAAWWYDRGDTISRMLDLLAADPDAAANNYYFDVANLHLYSRAEDIPRIITWYRQQLAARGMSKPIWIAETNAIPYDDPIWPASKAGFRATLDEQASYIIQAMATYLGLGVQRISVNRALDGTDFDAGGEPFGLIRNDGSLRPAFTAYQVVTRYFAGARDASYDQTPGGVTKVVLEKAGGRVTVLWTMGGSPTTATVEAIRPRALRVNKWGETSEIAASAGQYAIDLAGATANSNPDDPSDYVVGGEPVILVERDDDNLSAAVRSLDESPGAAPVAETPAINQQTSRLPTRTRPEPTKAKPEPTRKPTPTPKKR